MPGRKPTDIRFGSRIVFFPTDRSWKRPDFRLVRTFLFSLLLLTFAFTYSPPLWAGENAENRPHSYRVTSPKSSPLRFEVGDRILEKKALLDLLRSEPEYAASVDEIRRLQRKSSSIFIGTGVTGGAALIAGALLFGMGADGGRTYLLSGLGATFSAAVLIGVGSHFGFEARRKSREAFFDLLDRVREDPERPPVRLLNVFPERRPGADKSHSFQMVKETRKKIRIALKLQF